jgi:hypothetical protein
MFQSIPLAVLLAARLVINEVMIKPSTGGSEWIEIHNAGDGAVATAGLSIEDARGRPAAFPALPESIAAGSFLVLASNVERVLEHFADLDIARVVKPAGTWPALNDADGDAGFADAVVLRDASGAVLDSMAYHERWLAGAGRAIERLDPAGSPLLPANWSPSDDPSGGTPLRLNSLSPRPDEIGQGELIVPAAPFRPGVAGGARIGWHLDRPATLALEVFDLDGRPVRRLRPLEAASTVGRVVWDGADDAGRLCPPGLYVVLLEGRLDGEMAPRRWRRALVMGEAP